MNLIEVLWKQDVDIGVPPLHEALDAESPPPGDAAPAAEKPHKSLVKLEDEEEGEEDEGPLVAPLDPWAGLPYTIDLETGQSLFLFLVSNICLFFLFFYSLGAPPNPSILVAPAKARFGNSLTPRIQILGVASSCI